MLQATRSASGLIAVLCVFVAAGSDSWPAIICSSVLAVLFGVIELEEAREMGFLQEEE